MDNQIKPLNGKNLVLTGATGGLGTALCRYALHMGANLILLARSQEKALALQSRLKREFPESSVTFLLGDLLVPAQVQTLCKQLSGLPIDLLYLNAGDYHMERKPCKTGLDPVFQVNFLSQFYMAQKLLPVLQAQKGKLIVTGSIAHLPVRTDPHDPDFSRRSMPEAVYGNSKRYLMYACRELAKKYPDVEFAIAHPGITPTGITSHYPKALLRFLSLPMGLTFDPPRKAARGMAIAMIRSVPDLHWIGPGILHVWGKPAISPLTGCPAEERRQIYATAQKLSQDLMEDAL